MDDGLTPLVAQAQRWILDDIRDGIVPSTVRSFEELHDHVDANEYLSGGTLDQLAAVADRVNAWLVDGGPFDSGQIQAYRLTDHGFSDAPPELAADGWQAAYLGSGDNAASAVEDAYDQAGEDRWDLTALPANAWPRRPTSDEEPRRYYVALYVR